MTAQSYLRKLQELFSIILEVFMVDYLHAERHLMKDLGVSDGGSLFHECSNEMIDIYNPLVCAITEGKNILPVKEISIAQSAVWHTEYDHNKGYFLLADKQFYLTPVKFAFLTRLTICYLRSIEIIS